MLKGEVREQSLSRCAKPKGKVEGGFEFEEGTCTAKNTSIASRKENLYNRKERESSSKILTLNMPLDRFRFP